MNILYVSYHCSPENNAASARLHSHIKMLTENGYHVDLIAHKNATCQNIRNQYCLFVDLANNRSNFIVRLFFEIVVGVLLFVRILILKKYSIIVVSSPPYIYSIFGIIAGLLKGPMLLHERFVPRNLFDSGLPRQKVLGRFLIRLQTSILRKKRK